MSKKKIIICSLLILLAILSISSVYYFKTNKKDIKRNRKQNEIAIFIQEDGATDYTKSTSKDIPKGDYTLNYEKSYCKNNGVIGDYDSTLGKVSFSFVGTDSCFLYFDYNSTQRVSRNTDVILLNNGNGATTVDEAIKYIKSNEPDSLTGTSGDPMMCATEDNLGESYYFRGMVENNYLQYGEYTQSAYLCDGSLTGMDDATAACTQIANDADPIYWQIVRINGDGSLRLIYAGVNEPQSSLGSIMNEKSTIGKSIYSNVSGNSEFVGYTYTEGEQHGDTENSAIKELLDNWFINFTNLNDLEFIADGIFCNDRNADNWYSSTEDLFTYSANGRFSSLEPSLICDNKKDRFTVSDIKNGNGALTYPVGLITAEEALFGGVSLPDSANAFSFLRTSSDYWTMTPHKYSAGNSYVFYIFGGGMLSTINSNVYINTNYVRPVINLSSDVTLSGDGTVGNVYVVN